MFMYKMVKNWSWIRLAPRKWIKSTVSNLQRKSICSLYLKEVNHHTLEAVTQNWKPASHNLPGFFKTSINAPRSQSRSRNTKVKPIKVKKYQGGLTPLRSILMVWFRVKLA